MVSYSKNEDRFDVDSSDAPKLMNIEFLSVLYTQLCGQQCVLLLALNFTD